MSRSRRARFFGIVGVCVLLVASLLVAGGVALASIPSSSGVFHGCVTKKTGALRLIDPSAGKSCKSGEHAVTWNRRGLSWQGAWTSTAAYAVSDAVSFAGSSYVTTVANTGVTPGGATDWQLLSSGGNTVLHGSGAPDDSVGNVGDFYIDTTGQEIYGPKFHACLRHDGKVTCGDLWPSAGTSLIGPQGVQGIQGIQGDPGAQGPAGSSHVYGVSADEIQLHSFTDTRIATLHLAAGNYFLMAKLVASNDDGSDQDFTCRLDVNYSNDFTGSIDGQYLRLPGSSGIQPNYYLYPQVVDLQGTVYYDTPGYAVVECDTYLGTAQDVKLTAIAVGGIN